MWRCLPVWVLLGCGPEDEPWVPTPAWEVLELPTSCDGREIAEGQELEPLLFILGYALGEERSIITRQPGYDALVLEYGEIRGLEPDFETDVVLVHPWVYGGCGPGYEYRAWDWSGRVRVEAFRSADHGCDAYMPQVDVLWLRDVGGGVDWCD